MSALNALLPKGVFNSFGSPLLFDTIVQLQPSEIGIHPSIADARMLSGGTYVSPNEAAKAADCIMAKLNRSINETNGLLSEDERAAAIRMEWKDMFVALNLASQKSLQAVPRQPMPLHISPVPVTASLSNPPSSLLPMAPPQSRGVKKSGEPKAPKGGYKQKGSNGSKYLGVYRCSKTSKSFPWTCAVSVGCGVQVTLKAMETEEDAARLRDQAFYWLYGEHAKPHQMNFPNEQPSPLEKYFVEKLESRLVYAGLTRPALLHHDDEEEVVVALEDENFEPNDAELEEAMQNEEEKSGAEKEKAVGDQPIELDLLESLEQWLAPEDAKAPSKPESKRFHSETLDLGAAHMDPALGGMEWLLGGSMMGLGGAVHAPKAPIAQHPRKKARKAAKRSQAPREDEGEGEEPEEEPEPTLQQMAAAEEIKARLTEYLDYMRRAVKEVLPGYAKTYYPEGTEVPNVHYRMCSQCMQPTLKTVPCKKCRLNMKDKELELKKLEEGLIKVGMHSFLPIHEILLDPSSDHDLRFFPSMLRNNMTGSAREFAQGAVLNQTAPQVPAEVKTEVKEVVQVANAGV